MSVLTRISRIVKPNRRRRPQGLPPGATAGLRHTPARAQSVETKPAAPATAGVGGRLASNGHRPAAAASGPRASHSNGLGDSRVLAAAKTKQELLVELQQNYREVVDLVRRVKTHMETQDERFDRLMGVAEQIRESVQVTPGLREDARKALAALDQLAADQREGQARAENALQAHSGRLNRMTELMEQSSETEQRVASTLSDVGTTLSAMASATESVGAALNALQEREARRDAQLAGLLTRSHRWMIAITAMVGVATATGLILAAILAS